MSSSPEDHSPVFRPKRNIRRQTADLIFKPEFSDLFDAVRTGVKDVVIRLKTPRFAELEPGELLHVFCAEEKLFVCISAVRAYPCLSALLASENPDRIEPGKSRREIEKRLRKTYERSTGRKGVNSLRLKIDQIGLLVIEFRLMIQGENSFGHKA